MYAKLVFGSVISHDFFAHVDWFSRIMTLRKHELSEISLRSPQAQWRRQLMVTSHPAWLPFGAAVEQPRQGASAAVLNHGCP